MAALALKALSLGADKIPDAAFHAIPGGYFRPEGHHNPLKSNRSKSGKKNKKERDGESMHDSRDQSADSRSARDHKDKRHRSSRRESVKSDDYSASGSGSDTDSGADRKRPQRPTRRHRRYTSSRGLDRGYDSDGMSREQYQQSRGIPPPQQASNGQYFPPPPIHAFQEGPKFQSAPNEQYNNSGVDSTREDINRAQSPYSGSYFSQQVSGTA
jgi:hypothetical protein